MVYEIIQNNYACIVVCILFIVFVHLDRSFSKKVEIEFLVAMSVVFFATIIDNIQWIEMNENSPNRLLYFSTAVGYALRPVTAIVVTFIMCRNVEYNNKKILITGFLALFAFNMISSFLSIGTKLVFGYSENNSLYRGVLGELPFITISVYIFFVIFTTIKYVHKHADMEIIVVLMIGVLYIIGMLMESRWDFKGTFNISCGVGMIFYYLYLHVNIYSRDQLTNSYSRRILYLDVDKMKKENAIIVWIDLNNLKRINDEQGHAAGDEAIISLVNKIHKNIYRGCSLYRMGGDEFALLCSRQEMKEVETMMSMVAMDMESTQYSFAYGISRYNRKDEFEVALKEADEKMYIMKARMKAQR